MRLTNLEKLGLANPFQQQVSRGAAWLDSNRPGWEFKIDLAELNLAHANVCVLGQLDGNFWNSLSDMQAQNEDFDMEWAADHGFFVLGAEDEPSYPKYNQLTDAWRTEIKHRFDTGSFSDPEAMQDPGTEGDHLIPLR